jgi:hypothetical protein
MGKPTTGKDGKNGPGAMTNPRLLLGVALVVLAVGAYWWQSRLNAPSGEIAPANDGFAALVKAGQPVLERVRSPAAQGNAHLAAGATKNYVEPFPTSGDHAAEGEKAGFYDRELPKTRLVHSLEHGNVVIYYDTPGDRAIADLKDWTSRFNGAWDGVIATRSPGLGKALMLTAWTKALRMNEFEPAGAAAFIDAYRGRGPENRVR